MMIRNKCLVICLLCALLAPGLAISDDNDARLDALEARIEALEALIIDKEAQEEAPEEPDSEPVSVGSEMRLSDRLTMTINRYETGTKFRYYPSGGFVSSTLSAKAGYALLGLFVTVENHSGENVATADLLSAKLSYDGDAICDARDSFFYLTSRGVYAGGLKAIPPRTSVEGCILFALPENIAAESSNKQIMLRLQYGGTLFEHALRESGSLLQAEGEAIGF